MRKAHDLRCRAMAQLLLSAGLTLSRSLVVSQQQTFDDRMHVYMCVCCDKHDEQRGNKANKVAGSMSDRAQLALSLTSRRTTTGESGARTKNKTSNQTNSEHKEERRNTWELKLKTAWTRRRNWSKQNKKNNSTHTMPTTTTSSK